MSAGEQQQQTGAAAPAAARGLGFSIQGKARARVAVNTAKEAEERQLITAVAEDGTIQTQGPAPGSSSKQYVVPALKNTYKTGVGKFVPTFVPEASSAAVKGNAEDRFERAEVGHAPTLTTFGLEVRRRQDAAAGAAGGGDAAANGAAAAAAPPPADRPLVPVLSRAEEAAQLKQDLEELPDEATVEVGGCQQGRRLWGATEQPVGCGAWLCADSHSSNLGDGTGRTRHLGCAPCLALQQLQPHTTFAIHTVPACLPALLPPSARTMSRCQWRSLARRC